LAGAGAVIVEWIAVVNLGRGGARARWAASFEPATQSGLQAGDP
jgi:hypothetical protein